MKILKCLVLACMLSATVFGQENKPQSRFGDAPHSSHSFHLPSPDSLRDFSSLIDAFSGLPNAFLPFRVKRSIKLYNKDVVDPEEHTAKHDKPSNIHGSDQARTSVQAGVSYNNTHNMHERLSVITRVTSCDYANQAGNRCLNCHEAMTCFSNNRAVVRRCLFLLRYCNNGRCSFIPGDKCYNIPTTATESASTSSSASTVAATTPMTPLISSTTTASTTTISTTTSTSASTTSPTTSPASSSATI